MKYTEKVLRNAEFNRIQREISACERERIYCRHELPHALDVCRMAWIMYLEAYAGMGVPGGQEEHSAAERKNTESSADTEKKTDAEKSADAEELARIKDRIYVTGLLHDIGRARQCMTGEHHSVAGGEIAARILEEISYPQPWREETLRIITGHSGRGYRGRGAAFQSDGGALPENLSGQIEFFILRADHLSRNCFCCDAADSCKWKEEERNRTVLF